MIQHTSDSAECGWNAANEQFLLDHGRRWLAAFLHTQLPDVPLAQLLRSGRLLGYLAAVISTRCGCDAANELVAPPIDELVGKKRKPACVLKDVNAFLALAGRLGVDSRALFSTSDVVEGHNTLQVCCTFWNLSRCCEQLNMQGVPPFASPDEEDQWRLLMPQGSALMEAQRYGRLSIRRRSKDSVSLASSSSSPVQLDIERSESFKDEQTGEQTQVVLDSGGRQDSLTDDDSRVRTYSGSPKGPGTPSPIEPALSQTATMGSPPDADVDSPPWPRRPEPPRRLSLGYDAQPQEQPAAQRQAVSPVPPHWLGLVRRLSTDINTASPPPSPVRPAKLLPAKFAVSGFRGAPPVPRGMPVDASSREQQDDRVPPPVPLTKLADTFAAPPPPPMQQQQEARLSGAPVPGQLSSPSAEAAAGRVSQSAAALRSAASTAAASAQSAAAPATAAADVTTMPEQQAVRSRHEDEHSVVQPPSLQAADHSVPDQQARTPDSQQLPAAQHQKQQQHQPPAQAEQGGASVKVQMRPQLQARPKQRSAGHPPGTRLLGGKHREMPRLLRHVAIAAAGLAAGHLLHSMRARRSHLSVLDCDAVTRIPRHMLKDAVGPKPQHDPWRTVRG